LLVSLTGLFAERLLVIGRGGFAIADAFDVSGLNGWLGCQLMVFKDLPPTLAVLVVCFVITFTTWMHKHSAVEPGA
jgi:hypothetical protein